MADVSHFNIKIAVDAKNGKANVVEFGDAGKKAVKGIDDAAKKAGESFLSFSNIVKGAGLVALGALATSAVKGAAQMETYNTQFSVMLGSMEKANSLMAEVKKFGAETPYELPELADTAKNMLAYNFAQDEIIDNMRKIGDVASGVGTPLKELASIYGKARMGGIISTEDLDQLTDRGIPVIREFAKQLGVAEGDVRKMAGESKLNFKMLETAFNDLTSEGGQFYKMMDASSKTFTGLVSTLQDTIGGLLAEAATPFLGILKDLIGMLTPIIQQLSEFLVPIFADLAKVLGQVLPPFAELLNSVLKAMQPILAVVFKVLEKLAPVFSKLAGAVARLVQKLEPAIAIFAELIEDQLDELLPLLEDIIEIFILLTPVIALVAKAMATMTSVGLKMHTAVVKPLLDAIMFIIEMGAKAAALIASIFGGDDDKQTKAAKASAAATGAAGAGAGSVATANLGTAEGDAPPGLDPKAIEKAKKAAIARMELESKMSEHAKMVYDTMKKSYQESVLAQIKADEELAERRRANLDDYGSQLAKANDRRHQDELAEMEAADRIRGLKIANIEDEESRETALFNLKLDLLYKEAIAEEELAEKKKAIEREYAAAVASIRAASFSSGMSALSDSLGAIGELFNSSFDEMKTISIAQAIINTAASITQTLSTGGAFAIPQAIAVGLMGAAQVKKIIETKPGGGGGAPVTGLAQEGSAPSRGGAAPRRLNLASGAAGGGFPSEIKLVADGDSLVGVLQVNTRNRELAGV